jgi:hypothetical protein
MTWTWALATVFALGAPDAPQQSAPPAAAAASVVTAVAAVDDPATKAPSQDIRRTPPLWQISMRVAAPMTTTDPNHVAVALGVARTGAIRMSADYQPSETTALGGIHASAGIRLLRRTAFDLAFDLNYNQVWADRRLFRGTGWQLEGHDRRRLSLGIASVQLRERRYFGVIEGVELGAGRMYIRRLVSARAGDAPLNPRQEPILISSGPVGIAGVRLSRPLMWGVNGAAHVRVIGAGRSRGGELPFAHVTSEWSLSKPVFESRRLGRGELGLSGNHASSSRAATYFQNGLGLTLRIVF